MKRYSFLFGCLALIVIWLVVCYPKTQLKEILIVNVETPMPAIYIYIYMNDCLHPCIRCYEDSFMGYKYWMVQFPYYAKNNQIENPILYKSNDMMNWIDGIEVATRKSRGIARWRGTSLAEPDFVLIDTTEVDAPLLRDRWISTKVFGKRIFVPKLMKYDLWHLDLYEQNDTLFMVSCSEGSDNIMLYYSLDGKSWVINNQPLINNHALENVVGYRQTYYKPTAFVENDTTHLFFTSQDKMDSRRNVLYHSSFDK